MAGDLGKGRGEVHDEAGQVLDFWFALPTERQFGKDPALDAEITRRFGPLRDRLLATDAQGWRDDPDTLLAAVIALDQFSRNIHRGAAEAYAADELALELTRLAIRSGWDSRYPPERRAFLYMPLMHAENTDIQRLSVDRFIALGEPESLRYAREHAEVIERYGRFPSRNKALGRKSTREELDYLSQPGAGW